MRKELGKVKSASYGFGGYQECQFGLSVSLGAASWGVSDFWGFWSDDPGPGAKWTKEDQHRFHGETVDRIHKLLSSAKAKDVASLVGKPVEVEFDGMMLKSWRVLTEVI
jgi:hypothetical protein